MEHCYWTHNGKYQALVNELNTKAPDIGYTTNEYVNLYLAMAHLYYDAYNNGGCNIVDCYADDLHTKVFPLLPDVTARPFVLCEYEAMEKVMDRALEYLLDKDLRFPTYSIWLNFEQELLARVQPSDCANWTAISFGEEERMRSYCLRRTLTHGFRDVTDEICKGEHKQPSLDFAIQSAKEASTNITPTSRVLSHDR